MDDERADSHVDASVLEVERPHVSDPYVDLVSEPLVREGGDRGAAVERDHVRRRASPPRPAREGGRHVAAAATGVEERERLAPHLSEQVAHAREREAVAQEQTVDPREVAERGGDEVAVGAGCVELLDCTGDAAKWWDECHGTILSPQARRSELDHRWEFARTPRPDRRRLRGAPPTGS
jgi:hypothetical protein